MSPAEGSLRVLAVIQAPAAPVSPAGMATVGELIGHGWSAHTRS